ncbi:DUF2306 domain-containing protein [Arsenicibacter rosenii]|uniref:DUF2306 domain-containing protein n=1 Tax=Arsenicibacter rosenii TaxID=1750698 RepID=A0A1S2VG50_9BACT|nr:DUF2306 domain-containing protein [Arsenicibacter rosenii]OIN56878.1 hypothetical protein BLX24_22165 [Arsenicibacter rosenii]
MISDSPSVTRRPSSFSVWSARLLQWSTTILGTSVWVSSALFGLYILAFYATALLQNDMQRWNGVLPRLYTPGESTSNGSMGLHFAAGGIILILGSIQLLDSVRLRYPALHRWIGRFYVLACLSAAIGGLTFILLQGTIGGTVMNIGFGLYGLLMGVAAVETFRHARAGRLETHRIWALRLYALAIGSWLYRMDYGFWVMLTDAAGHNQTFSGPFDQFMAFFFYVPNLLVVELLARARKPETSAALRLTATLAILFATFFIGLGTYYFTKIYWGPPILAWFS